MAESNTEGIYGGRRRRTRKVVRVGSRAKVMHGGAEMTSGGLRKEHLKYNKSGRIVSVKRSSNMTRRHKAYGGGDEEE
jgi:hypothetical protein